MSTDSQRRAHEMQKRFLGAVFACALGLNWGCAATARGVRSSAPAPAPGTSSGNRPASSFSAARVETQDTALAAALVNVLVSRTPGNLVAVAYRYYQLGIRDTAMKYYAAALSLDRTYAPALDGAARVWRDWGELGAALGDAHRAVYFEPQAAPAWNTLGTVRQALDRKPEAAAAYNRAISVQPDATYARSNLCYLAFESGDGETALAHCREALSTDGRFVPARHNLALVFAAGGDWEGAVREFARASSAAIAQYNTGILLMATRQYSAAARIFDSAYAADPHLAAAHARAVDARRRAVDPGTPQ